MPDWVVAGDIGARLAELRECLGEGQRAFSKRFGRTWKRVSAWENGQSVPPRSVLADAAERYGWDTGMFTEGGPYPKQALECVTLPQEARSGGEPGSVRGPGRRKEDVELRAAGLRKDAARLDRLVTLLRVYRDSGRGASPEVLAEWLEIAGEHATPPSQTDSSPGPAE